jgi:dihydrofolate reductase
VQFNRVPKHVVSRTLERVEWNNSTLITDDIVARIADLKRKPGNELQVHGSGELIQTLLRHHLVDELRLWTFPLLLGTGKRLFQNGTVPARLAQTETKVSSTGVVLQVLKPAGSPEYGSFQVEPPAQAELERRHKVEVGG